VILTIPLLTVVALGYRGVDRPTKGAQLSAVVVSLPLLVGLILPARPLSSAAIPVQGPQSGSAKGPTGLWALASLDSNGTVPLLIDMRQLAGLSATDPSLSRLDGRAVSLLGFVYRTPTLPANQFLLERFVVQCCTADAVALSVLVQRDGADSLARDTWVQVEGSIHYLGAIDSSLPFVDAVHVDVVPQPSRPYVYP
jgi:uncharacterized repeat protein (TIGR03943 family)